MSQNKIEEITAEKQKLIRRWVVLSSQMNALSLQFKEVEESLNFVLTRIDLLSGEERQKTVEEAKPQTSSEMNIAKSNEK